VVSPRVRRGSVHNGAITYVEYGYAQQRGFPVASVLNKAGYFTQPTANAASIALQGVTLNADGTQKLEGVYAFPDARSYPVSSYSYMIVPTTTAAPFNAAKGATLSKFIVYFVCVGQQKAAQLGYLPLPKNLVQIAFDSVNKIPGHVAPPPIDQCDNPTIRGTFVTGDAPPPLPSDRQGATPPTTQPGTSGPAASGGTGNSNTSGSGGTGTRSNSPTGASGRKVKAPGSDGLTDPSAINDATPTRASGPLTVPPARDPLSVLLYVVAGVLVLLAVFGPPALAMVLKRRKG
jgi:phosphate transport system substrate-binding protein